MLPPFPYFKDKLLKGSLILFAGNLVGSGCNYFFQFFMSRNLSVSDFGAMNSLLSLLMITAVPAVSILLVSTKYVSNFKAAGDLEKIRLFQKKVFKKLGSYGIGILLLMLLASPWVAAYLKIDSYTPVIIVFLLIFFSFLIPVNLGVVQGLQRFLALGFLGSFSGFSRLMFGILLIILGFSLNGAMMAILLASLTLFLVPFYFLRDIPASDPEVDDLGIGVKRIISYSTPVVLSSLGIMALTNMDLILVKHYFPAEQAGVYASVAVLGRTVFYFPGVIVMAMFPIVSESYALSKNPSHLLKKALGVTILLAGLGLIVLFIVPDLMLSFLFGKIFSQGAPLLRMFSIAMFFVALTNILANFHLAIERRWFLVVLLLGCTIEIVLISLFHQTLVTVLIILTAVNFLILVFLMYQTLRLNLKESLIKSAALAEFTEIEKSSV